jgi:hypothetical protein
LSRETISEKARNGSFILAPFMESTFHLVYRINI